MTFTNLMILYIMAVLVSVLSCRLISKRGPPNNDEHGPSEDVIANVAVGLAWIVAGLCFPPTARVSLENGQSQRMSKLQIGDRVQTVLPEGNIVYTEVTSFLDKRHATVNIYKSIETFGSETISLSGKHFIYGRRKWTEIFKPIYADKVCIFDEVLWLANDRVIPVRVKNISNIYLQGAHSPLTMEGKIMVDGVLSSCYASFPDHDMAHFAMSPIRWFPKLIHWIFGEDNESPIYVKIFEHLGRSVLPNILL